MTRSHLCVLITFAIISVIVTWPLVIKFGDGIPFGGDGFQFIWNGWWYSKASADPELDLWWTPWQFAPSGSPLITHDFSPLNAWAQSKLAPVFGIFESHNILILANYILGAWGAYILAWYFTGNRAASFIAGIIYGFSTFHAMHLAQLSTVSSAWLPLSVYYMVKFIRDGGSRDGLFAILTLTACALTHWYNLAFALLTIFLFMLFGQIGLRKDVGGRKRWMHFAIPVFASLLILSSLIIDAWNEFELLDLSRRAGLGEQYFLDPLWLLLPSPDHPVFGNISAGFQNALPMNFTEGIASLGIITIVLGIGAWFRKNPTTRVWCWIGLVMFLLALGSVITVAGMKTGIPGPYNLWSMIPGLDLARIPARFIGPFTLALAMSSAGFIAGLSKKWFKGWKGGTLIYVIPAVIIFETLIIPIPISGSELIHPELENIDEHCIKISGEDYSPDIAVNFPILPPQSFYLLQQTVHGIPTFDSMLANPPPDAVEFFISSYIYPAVYWKRDVIGNLGIDVVLFHPKIASMAFPDGIPYGDEDISPYEMFVRLGYTVAYEDDELVIFVLR